MASATYKRKRSILPGFGLTMGYTLVYLSLIVLIPLAGLFVKSATMTRAELWAAITDRNLLAALRLTVGLSLLAACINVAFGFVTAWTLVRFPFPGRRLVDALIDLPFALPTAVGGITLATLYASNGWLGRLGFNLADALNGTLGHLGLSSTVVNPQWLRWLNLDFAYSRTGMLIALVFIGAPFVVRTLQPALEDMDPEVEEAAASLGASRFQAFRRVVLPGFLPAILTGFSLAFARAMGEYGSVIFISNNLPGKTQVASRLIADKLEKPIPDYNGAATLGIIMLVISFAVLISINGLQWWAAQRSKSEGA